jgi:hypothetical protein
MLERIQLLLEEDKKIRTDCQKQGRKYLTNDEGPRQVKCSRWRCIEARPAG